MTTTEITNPYAEHMQVIHPLHGVGLVLRPFRNTHVDVQWPGVSFVRREHIESVERYVPPAPTPKRRPRRAR